MLAVEATPILVAVITTILGGGFFGGIYALMKLRPEAGQITVTAAEGVVVIQERLLNNLDDNYRRALDEMGALRKRIDHHATEVAEMRRELKRVTAERDRLRKRVSELEAQVAELKAHDAERS